MGEFSEQVLKDLRNKAGADAIAAIHRTASLLSSEGEAIKFYTQVVMSILSSSTLTLMFNSPQTPEEVIRILKMAADAAFKDALEYHRNLPMCPHPGHKHPEDEEDAHAIGKN